MTTYF
jgi:hypothetical protein